MASEPKTSNFKVVIVGGGPIGLTAAHALHLAGIDFVLLERRPSIVEDLGASLVVYPHTFRVMKQFGILEPLLAAGSELVHHLSLTADGHVFKEGTRYTRLRENHGYGATTIHRADVVSALYTGLPPSASSKILTNKTLSTITPQATGITVTCTDGTTHDGTILIGADGVHSATRALLRTAALASSPPIPWDDPSNPFPATYQLLFGAFPSPSPAGLGYDIQAKDKAIMYLSGATRSWFFLYKKLPSPTTARARYTDADVQAVAAEFADFPLTDTGVKVKDVWPTMLGAGLTDLGEGIASRWSLGRAVLVGDACHKFTTHLGLGFNNGVQDVVVLVNMLRAAVEKGGGGLDGEGIRRVFEGYEEVRKSKDCSLMADAVRSGQETRMHAWANTGYYLLSRWFIVPKFVEDLVVRFVISPELRKGRVLDFVAAEEPMNGRMSWLYPMTG